MQQTIVKDQCTCGNGVPCCVGEVGIQGKCTCGTGTPCCVHKVEKTKQGDVPSGTSQGKIEAKDDPECTC